MEQWRCRDDGDVLLVDADPEAAAVMCYVLSEWGFAVRWARTPLEGWSAFGRGGIRAAVIHTGSGVTIPGVLTGLELAERLRAMSPGLRIVIVPTSPPAGVWAVADRVLPGGGWVGACVLRTLVELGVPPTAKPIPG